LINNEKIYLSRYRNSIYWSNNYSSVHLKKEYEKQWCSDNWFHVRSLRNSYLNRKLISRKKNYGITKYQDKLILTGVKHKKETKYEGTYDEYGELLDYNPVPAKVKKFKLEVFDDYAGKRLWELYNVYSDLIISKNKIIIIYQNKVAAFKIDNGKLVWDFKPQKEINSSLNTFKNIIYFFDSDYIYALDINEGKLSWSNSFKNNQVESYNSIQTNTDELISIKKESTVYTYNVSSGKLIWKKTTGKGKWNFFNKDNNYLYVFITNEGFSDPYDPDMDEPTTYFLKVFNQINGSKLWEVEVDESLDILIDNGVLYLIDGERNRYSVLYKIHPQQAKFLGSKSFDSYNIPIITKDKIYQPVNTYRYNKLYALDNYTGDILWEKEFSRPINPVLTKDCLVGIQDKFLLLINIKDGRMINKINLGERLGENSYIDLIDNNNIYIVDRSYDSNDRVLKYKGIK